MEQGIDVSRYQGSIDWPRAAAAGISFAVVRAGCGSGAAGPDVCFARNCAQAAQAGLALGCYWYSHAANEQQARAEAQACLRIAQDAALPLGIWFDQEYEKEILALNNAQRTAAALAFLRAVGDAGRTAGLYCSADWLKHRLETEQFSTVNLWLAQYAPRLEAPWQPRMWQYTGAGRLDGIAGPVDRDVLYSRPQPAARGPAAAAKGGTADGLLRTGSRGSAVRALQAQLAAAGCAPGPADGIFGARTCAAVRAFQKRAGLAADGIAGPRTMAALRAASAGK